MFALRSTDSKFGTYRDKMNNSSAYGYTLLSYDEKKKNLKLRNPWGWYQEPSKFTQGAPKSVTDDGEFTIALSDAIKYFDVATICNYHESNWSVSHSVRQLPDIFSQFTITVK